VEVKRHAPRTPMLLVGTKKDLREERYTMKQEISNLISQEQGRQIAEELGVDAYVECSAKKMEGIKDVLEKAVKAIVHSEKRKSYKYLCNLM
jgi:GTPase SAR1 family protein